MKNHIKFTVRSILFSFVLIVIFSCSTDRKIDIESKILNIGSPVVLDDLEDVFSNVELIFLDTVKDAYISDVRKTYVKDGRYYIQNNRREDDIFIFEGDGTFYKSTKSIRGRAKNEISTLSDYIIDTTTNKIEVYDPFKTRITKYNSEMKYISEIKLPQQCRYNSSFEKVDDNSYIFTGTERTFYLFNSEDNTIIKSDPLTGGFPPRNVSSSDVKNFHKCSDGLFYIPRFDKHIYTLHIDDHIDLYSRYTLELTNNPLTPKHITETSSDELHRSGELWDYSLFDKRYINDKYIIVSYLHISESPSLKFYIYDRISDRSLCFDGKFKSGDTIPSVLLATDSELYCIVPAEWITTLFPKYQFDLTTMYRINNINDNDNYVVVKYTFKEELPLL